MLGSNFNCCLHQKLSQLLCLECAWYERVIWNEGLGSSNGNVLPKRMQRVAGCSIVQKQTMQCHVCGSFLAYSSTTPNADIKSVVIGKCSNRSVRGPIYHTLSCRRTWKNCMVRFSLSLVSTSRRTSVGSCKPILHSQRPRLKVNMTWALRNQ